MSQIKHIVHLMLENRSFDQLLGWLYDEKNPPKINIPAQDKPSFDGLKENTFFNLDSDGNKHYVVKGTDNMNVPIHDPHEEYSYINDQLFESQANPTDGQTPTMGGFYQDFATYNDHTEQIMQTYTPADLPVLNGLAREFAVSDRYFCSVPTQTNCNRAFAACGNSIGVNSQNQLEAFVNNRDFSYHPPNLSQPEGRQFNQKTLWNVMSENGFDTTDDWMHYYSKGSWWEDLLGLEGYAYTRDLMQQLQDQSLDAHFDTMDTFYQRAKDGTLPKVCFLEPEWGLEFPVDGKDFGINGCDYHPPTNLLPGEAFVKKVYDALTSNTEAWKNTLFIINFDEHGGTYDHVAPPWGAAAPWASDGTPKPGVTELGFEFNRFGVRVPLILVSPQVKASTVFRSGCDLPYDHTSVIATILTMLGVDKANWGLGARTANAPTFGHILEGNPLRDDIPQVHLNTTGKVDSSAKNCVNDIHLHQAQSLLNRFFKSKGLTPEQIKGVDLPSWADADTTEKLSGILRKALDKVDSL